MFLSTKSINGSSALSEDHRVGSRWRSGLQMAAIGLTAGLAGFLIGHFIGALPV